MKALLTVEDLAEHLHKSVASIRSDSTRNPKSLPPICRLPNTKRLLWRVEDVEHWLALHVQGGEHLGRHDIPAPEGSRTPKRGRPTKAEQIARQRLKGDGGATDSPSPSARA